jgi:hypothetical protein
MFPTSNNIKCGQTLINLDKMPTFYQLEPKQQMIDITKIPMFALGLSSQEPLSTVQDCPLSISE